MHQHCVSAGTSEDAIKQIKIQKGTVTFKFLNVIVPFCFNLNSRSKLLHHLIYLIFVPLDKLRKACLTLPPCKSGAFGEKICSFFSFFAYNLKTILLEKNVSNQIIEYIKFATNIFAYLCWLSCNHK